MEKRFSQVTGVIHVGANIGQEIAEYAMQDFDVLWIEPIPRYFDVLLSSLQGLSKQRAFQALITDKDDHLYDFYIASNAGGSSSILKMKHHATVWPKIKYMKKMQLLSMTLPTLLQRAFIDISVYPALVVDTQGSELLVLQGSKEILRNFSLIKIEAANYEAYENCCLDKDISDYLDGCGFYEIERHIIREHYLGTYYDILYERR